MSAHVVETLDCTCRFDTAQTAWELQGMLEAFLREEGQQVLERVFDRFSPPGEIWSLETLEVDLGALDADAPPEAWAERLEARLTERLAELRAALHVPPRARTEDAGRRQSLPMREVADAVHALRHGHAPWSHDAAPSLDDVVATQGATLLEALDAQPGAFQALQRLGQQTSPEALQALVARRHPALVQALALLERQLLDRLVASGQLRGEQGRRLSQHWRVTVLQALAGNPVPTPEALAHLQRTLGQSLAQALGAEPWTLPEPWEALGAIEAPLAAPLLQGLLSPPGSAPGAALLAHLEARGEVTFRMWSTLHRALLAGAPLGDPRLPSLLRRLGHRAPEWLHHTLRTWGLRRTIRWRWAEQLPGLQAWSLLETLASPVRPEAPEAILAQLEARGMDGASLDESLRQFGLAARRRHPGLSGLDDRRLRALLLDHTFRRVLQGGSLPQDHVAWQRLWEEALQTWAPVDAPEPMAAPPREVPPMPPAPQGLPAGREALLKLLKAGGGAAVRLKLAELLASTEAREAWLAESAEADRWALLEAMLPGRGQALKVTSDRLLKAAAELYPHQAQGTLAQAHWTFLARHLFEQGLDPAPGVLVRRYAQHLAQFERKPDSPVAAFLHRVFQKLASWFRRGPAPLPDALRALAAPPTASETWEAAQADTPPEPVRDDPTTGTARNPVYVSNAGLVLLNPFLERLFASLGLTEGRAFRNDAARARAIHCLEYLACGHTDTAEFAWPLDKLLVGLAIAQPVPPCAGLDEATCATLDGLLQAVIAHWKVLGRTSVAGLRETFLCREGRLTRVEGELGDGWRLQVEGRAFDVLMDRLPWGFSVIRLPWMEGVLHVEWR